MNWNLMSATIANLHGLKRLDSLGVAIVRMAPVAPVGFGDANAKAKEFIQSCRFYMWPRELDQ